LLSLSNPEQVLRELAREERQLVYEDRLAAKHQRLTEATAEAARSNRREKLRLEARVMNLTHDLPHLPRLFTGMEVDELNLQRPPKDQFELMPSGLLRHHCCFPACKSFLQNFATERDRQLGKRGGMFCHLKFMVVPDRRYWPGLHLVATSVFAQRRFDTQAAYVAEVQKGLRRHPGFEASCKDKPSEQYLRELLGAIFDQLSDKP
jgi:hypothetical protein